MLKIGITGGIGSGKTLVSNVFEKLGVATYNADSRAKFLMDTHPYIIENIKSIFGDISYSGSNLNRKYIASQIFSDTKLLEQLNSIVHPIVKLDFNDWCKAFAKEKFILKEAAILFESNSHTDLDSVIVVSAPVEMRIKRVIKRDKLSEEDVLKRINKQWTNEKLCSMADYILINDGSQLIMPQIINIQNKILHTWQNMENG